MNSKWTPSKENFVLSFHSTNIVLNVILGNDTIENLQFYRIQESFAQKNQEKWLFLVNYTFHLSDIMLASTQFLFILKGREWDDSTFGCKRAVKKGFTPTFSPDTHQMIFFSLIRINDSFTDMIILHIADPGQKIGWT